MGRSVPRFPRRARSVKAHVEESGSEHVPSRCRLSFTATVLLELSMERTLLASTVSRDGLEPGRADSRGGPGNGGHLPHSPCGTATGG